MYAVPPFWSLTADCLDQHWPACICAANKNQYGFYVPVLVIAYWNLPVAQKSIRRLFVFLWINRKCTRLGTSWSKTTNWQYPDLKIHTSVFTSLCASPTENVQVQGCNKAPNPSYPVEGLYFSICVPVPEQSRGNANPPILRYLELKTHTFVFMSMSLSPNRKCTRLGYLGAPVPSYPELKSHMWVFTFLCASLNR